MTEAQEIRKRMTIDEIIDYINQKRTYFLPTIKEAIMEYYAHREKQEA